MFRSQTDYEKMKTLLENKSQSDELKRLVRLTVEFDNAKTTSDVRRLQDEMNKLNKDLSTPEFKELREQVEKAVADYEKKFDALFKKALKMRAQGKKVKKSSKPLNEKKEQKMLEKKFVLSGATHSTLSSQDEDRLQLNTTIIDLQKKIKALHWLQEWAKENSMVFYDKLSVTTLEESKQLLTELKEIFKPQGTLHDTGSENSFNQDSLLQRINNQLIEIEKLLKKEIQTSEPSSNPSPAVIIEEYTRKETREALKAVVPKFESYWGDLMEKKRLPSLKAPGLRGDKTKKTVSPDVVSGEPLEKPWKATKRSDANAISQFGLLGSSANAKRKVPVEPLNEPAAKFKK